MTGPELRILGRIRTRHTDPQHTPVQSALNRADEATIELDVAYADALDGLRAFTHAWLLTWLGSAEGMTTMPALRQVPFLLQAQRREIGILATRGPRRPNPIGLSLVQILAVDGVRIRFAGVDMVDGTPVIDIKPYVGRFDEPVGAVRNGWFDGVTLEDGSTPARLRDPDP